MILTGSIREGSISGFSFGRGQQLGAPKSSFGAATWSTVDNEREAARLRNQLDALHSQIRTTPSVTRLCDLVDDYLVVAATLADTAPGAVAPMPALLPLGRIFAAVIAALRKNRAAAAPTGNVGPVVSGDNIGTPKHSLI